MIDYNQHTRVYREFLKEAMAKRKRLAEALRDFLNGSVSISGKELTDSTVVYWTGTEELRRAEMLKEARALMGYLYAKGWTTGHDSKL